jgi:lactate dehydrogenase-like 2-hydroxyacid dehydrogenase
MRMFISRPMPETVAAAARADFDVTLRPHNLPLTQEEMVAALCEFDVIVPTLGDLFRAPVFAACPAPRARLLANFGMGYNHIDVAAAQAAGLAVTNTPGAVTEATADIALTLVLMSARRAGEGERLVRAGLWQGWHPTQMLGHSVAGRVLGIVGMGRIGQAIARRAAHGFGMEVVYHTRSPRPLPGLEMARALPDLHAVMAAADFVVVAVPATPQTHHLINAPALAAMKPSAHLINVARGDIVDEAALITALEAGQIAGAGLDVYEFEPAVPEALRRMENVVLLPHLGTAVLEVREAMGMVALENARAFKAGKALPNAV